MTPRKNPQGLPEGPILTRREAAERLRVSVQTIDAKIASGQLRAYRIGTRVVIAEADLAAIMRPTGGAE